MSILSVTAGNEAPQDGHLAPEHSFNIGTRKSALALKQTNLVIEAAAKLCPEYTYVVKARDTAAGDIDKVTPFKDMPVKNIWTHELETLMMEGELDFLCHSLKGKITSFPCYNDLRDRCTNPVTTEL